MQQLTLRLRKPGIILLRGQKTPCACVKAALERLGPGFRCEVWTVHDASQKLQDAVHDHDGEVWTCTSTHSTVRIEGRHRLACSNRGWDEAVAIQLDGAHV